MPTQASPAKPAKPAAPATAPAQLCIHCQHFNGDVTLPRCNAPTLQRVDLVTGSRPIDCRPERERGRKCGREGKLFLAAVRGAV